MPLVDIGDAEIHYDFVGTGQPLLLVAGLGGSSAYWDVNTAELSRHSQLVLHDHRGTGKSSKSEIAYTVEGIADDLVRTMDRIGVQRADLLGHSMGGAIGMVTAARHPDRIGRLIVYASWTRADAQMKLCFETRKTMLQYRGAEGYCRATPLFLYPPWYIHSNWEALEREIAAAIAAFPPASIADSRMDAVLAFESAPYTKAIRCPTLVLVAADDILTPPYFSERLASDIPGARLEILEKGGHACSRTVPDRFNRAVIGFLKQSSA